MRKIVIIMLLISVSAVFVLGACNASEAEYFEELEEKKAEFSEVITSLALDVLNAEGLTVSFETEHKIYPHVDREGWRKTYTDSDGAEKKAEWVNTVTNHTVTYNESGWVWTAEANGEITEYVYDKNADKLTGTPQIAGETPEYANFLSAALTDFSDADGSVYNIDIAKRIGKDIYRIYKLRPTVYDDAKPYKTGYSDNLKFLWDNVVSLRYDTCVFTVKNGKISEIELSTENIMVFYKEKSVINPEKELTADVYETTYAKIVF